MCKTWFFRGVPVCLDDAVIFSFPGAVPATEAAIKAIGAMLHPARKDNSNVQKTDYLANCFLMAGKINTETWGGGKQVIDRTICGVICLYCFICCCLSQNAVLRLLLFTCNQTIAVIRSCQFSITGICTRCVVYRALCSNDLKLIRTSLLQG